MAREMKDSGIEWFGKIPSDWEITAIKRKFTLFAGATPKSEIPENWDGDIVWITPADYKTIDKYVSQGKRNISKIGLSSCSTMLIPCNSIIFSKRAPIGSVAINSVPLCTNQGCISSVPKKGVNTVFYYYLMSICTEQFELYSAGTTFKEISASNFGNFKIVFPSSYEQGKIAKYLDKKIAEIDTISSDIQSQIGILEDYKKSAISEAVTKGLNPDVEMKDSGIEWICEIPTAWNIVRTLYVLAMPITDGPHITPELYDDGIPFVSAEAVSFGNGKIDFSHIRGYISDDFYRECCKKYIPQINDIYMIKSGATTGRIAIVDTNDIFTIWSPLAVFRCNENKMIHQFMFYSLQADYFQKQIEQGWTYGTQQNIGMRTLERLRLCCPPIAEQKKIANYLDKKCAEIDDAITKKREQLEILGQYKKSLIFECVTGKNEVFEYD